MILVTGINGFVGKHLARELATRGIAIVGVGQRESEVDAEISPLVTTYYQCDVTVPSEVANLPLKDIDCVINLAGLANVGASFDNPELYMQINVDVLKVLGATLHEANPAARMIAVSTGALYDPGQPMPLTEESQTITSGSPYAMSKLAMEQAARDLQGKGQECIVVRPFNHIGPGQGLGFLIPDLAHKLQSADPAKPTITAGNLKTIRDYTDVRDIAKAYADLATSSQLNFNLYNVCSGSGRSGEDIVKALCNALSIPFDQLKIDIDQSLIRPSDPAKIVGDNTRLCTDTGWSPSIDLQQTVQDIIASLE